MVTVAGGTLLADQQIQADEQNPANQSGDSSQDLLQETPATTNDAATTVAPTISADANTASVNIPVADATSTTTAATDRAASPTANAATVNTNSNQQPLQTVQQQRIRQIQKLVHVVVVLWRKLVKPTPTHRLVSNGSTANNTMSIVTVVYVKTSFLSKTVSLITLILKQGLLRPSHRMNFQQNLSRQP